MSGTKSYSTDKWLVLVVSLPAANTTLRMRVWRALKGLGCAVLRDGVYLLPAGRGLRQALRVYCEEVRQGGGNAYLLNVGSASGEERHAFQAMFDRTPAYRELMDRMKQFQTGFGDLDAAIARKRLKALRRDLEGISALDYFPGAVRFEAEDRLAETESVFLASLSPGESGFAAGGIAARDPVAYRGRVWATRRDMWVDRVASAWLVRRFIDPAARFVWLEKPEQCPPEAVGLDFAGAEFSHVGKRVTFEALLAAFALEADAALMRIGAVVHFLDVGGVPSPEAAGVGIVLTGLKRQCADDDAFLARAGAVFDSLYAAFEE